MELMEDEPEIIKSKKIQKNIENSELELESIEENIDGIINNPNKTEFRLPTNI
jgi:hypothetical protein